MGERLRELAPTRYRAIDEAMRVHHCVAGWSVHLSCLVGAYALPTFRCPVYAPARIPLIHLAGESALDMCSSEYDAIDFLQGGNRPDDELYDVETDVCLEPCELTETTRFALRVWKANHEFVLASLQDDLFSALLGFNIIFELEQVDTSQASITITPVIDHLYGCNALVGESCACAYFMSVVDLTNIKLRWPTPLTVSNARQMRLTEYRTEK